MKHQCWKYKEDKGVKCTHPGCTAYKYRKKIVGKTLKIPTKGVLAGYPGSRNLMVKPRVDWSKCFYKETWYDHIPRQ